MCLIVFAWQMRPELPLAVAANRDEFHRRSTAASCFWQEHPDLLAGRDLEAGGTWMGVTRQGRFAAITNYWDPALSAPGGRSRGELPAAFLTGSARPAEFLQALASRAGDYAGFNLLVGDGSDLWYLSNSAHEGQPRSLAPGIYGLSNARLDYPWPKLTLAKAQLAPLLDLPSLSHDRLRQTVSDRRLAAAEALPPLGLGTAMDHKLSAQFIVSEDYGTRSTTSFWLQQEPAAKHLLGRWEEVSFDSSGREVGRQTATFSREAAPQGRGA